MDKIAREFMANEGRRVGAAGLGAGGMRGGGGGGGGGGARGAAAPSRAHQHVGGFARGAGTGIEQDDDD
jgi:hypothetical protein